MVALGVIALALQVATPAPQLAPGETLLEISATGEAKGVPDVATFTSGVSADGATAQAALAANSAIATRLIAAAEAAGLSGAGIRTQGIRVGPRYRTDKDGDDTQEIVGYRASNELSFRVTNIATVPKVIDALVKAGATDLNGPSFEFGDEAPLTRTARSKAIRQAATQATDYASALDMRVGRILRVSERSARSIEGGDIVVTGRKYTAPPVRPGEQSVNVTVWIDYALNK